LAEIALRLTSVPPSQTLLTKALALNLAISWRTYVLKVANPTAGIRIAYAFGTTILAVEVGRLLAYLQPEQDVNFFIGDPNDHIPENIKQELEGEE
jgi:hypothetical protein